MLSEVDSICGVPIPPQALLRFATVDTLAPYVQNLLSNSDQEPIVMFNSEGLKPPLVFRHGDIHGGGYFCRTLAYELGKDQPFFVLTNVDLPPGADPGDNEIAGHATRELNILRGGNPMDLTESEATAAAVPSRLKWPDSCGRRGRKSRYCC